MKKFALLSLVFIAACAGLGSTAATVNGKAISVSAVEAAVSGAEGAVDVGAFRSMLRVMVVGELAEAAAVEQFGIEPTEEQLTAKFEEIKTAVQAETDQALYDLAADQGFSPDGVTAIVRQQVIADLVTARLVEDAGPLDEADVEQAYKDQLFQFIPEACVKHVLLASEEEALAVKERIEDGEDFATVAGETSIDPSAAENGGDLGCAPLANYVPEFASAAATARLKTVTDPVQSQFGFHVIWVEAREDAAPLDEVRDQITAQLEGSRSATLFEEWLVEVVSAGTVEVDPQYGTWTTEPGPDILPPTTTP